MGNQSSREQQKDTESLLSSWSLKKQTQLKEQYTQLLRTSSEKEGQADDADAALTKSIPTDRLVQAIVDRDTPIQPELATALSLYIAQLSNTSKRASSSSTVYFQGFLNAARNVNHNADAPTIALYTVYTFAYQKYQCTLETFVLWLVKTAIPLWFEGSGIAKPTDSLWHQQQYSDNTIEASPPQRLMEYLVYREQKRKDRRKKREQEEMALWADDTADANHKEKAQQQTNTWHYQATQTTRAVDESAFASWITNTPIVLTLFQITASVVFFGKAPASDDNDDKDARHQDRIVGRLSPVIQKPSGNMFGKGEFSKLLTPYDYFMLTRSLPANARSWSSYEQSQRRVSTDLEHHLIFSSRRDGTSWQVLVNRIVNQGATLLVIKTKDGSVFGAYADEEWKPVTDWYGSSSNFLFRIQYPTSGGGGNDDVLREQNQLAMDTWDGGRGSNSNFQYLCWGKQSLPNALVMGGQFDYAGLWLDSDFLHGHSKAGPVCTTYQSPQLSLDQNFTVDEIEVFLVRPLLRNDDDDMMQEGGGVLSRAEDMEFMEMAGKKLYSRDLQEPERLDDDDEEDDNPK